MKHPHHPRHYHRRFSHAFYLLLFFLGVLLFASFIVGTKSDRMMRTDGIYTEVLP